jgi:hypothetical protein
VVNWDSIFNLEVREKKNQVFNSKAKTGSKGGSKSRKGMRTASDYLSKEEKKKLNGEVERYNMYETILNWSEWQNKDKETQKMLLTKWREIYPNSKIMAELAEGRHAKFNSQSFNEIVQELGCPAKARSYTPRKSKTKVVPIPQEVQLEKQPEPIQQLITSGMHFEYNGDFDSQTIGRILTKLQLLVEGEDNKFHLSISLQERA